jgi:hypothetical protein
MWPVTCLPFPEQSMNSASYSLFRRFAGLVVILVQVSVGNAQSTSQFVNLTPEKVVADGSEVFALGFDKLSSFPYQLVDAGTGATPEQIAEHVKKDQVPPWIHVYDKQRVLLTGYMMPLQIENGRSKKFVMMRDVTTCCYGAVPNMNDYLVVTMKDKGIEVVQDVPVELLGTFRIEQKYEGGYVVSLFVMDGEKLLGVKK